MKEKYSIDQIYDIQWLKCIRVVIWNLNKENLETSVKKIIDLIGDRYPFSSCLFISQLIHTAVSSRVGDFNIYFQFLKLFDSKKENNYHIINVFIWYLNNILTQESNFLLEKLYEQNLVTPTNFKIKKNLFFAHQMTEEEVNSLELIDPFRQIFYENVLELMKDNWKLHKKLVHELVNPNEIAKIIRVDDLEDLQEISSRNNFDYKQIIKPSLYERYSFINQKNVTLIDYSAFFGAIRCFKYLMLNDSDLKNTGKYAIAGGNEEIIHLCEQNYSTFEDAYETAIEFHRNGIFKYIYENKIGKINNLEELGQKCIEYNNFEIFLFLRSEGMKINNSIINESAEIGNIFLTKYFLKEYEIPNDIILFSALSRNIEHIKYILEQDGIDINAKGRWGDTALMNASEKEHFEVIQLLLEQDGIDINAKDKNGWTALIWSAKNGNVEITNLLLKQKGINFNDKNKAGWSALTFAARFGYTEIVKLLLEQEGIDINTRANRGYTPLMLASKNGQFETVKLLIEQKNIDINLGDDDGNTALTCASHIGYVDIVKLLLQRKEINLNAKIHDGWTALMRAAQNGHVEVVKLLIKQKDIDINAKNIYNMNARMIAVMNHRKEIVKLLDWYNIWNKKTMICVITTTLILLYFVVIKFIFQK